MQGIWTQFFRRKMAAIFWGDFYAAGKSNRPARALCVRDSSSNFLELKFCHEWQRVATSGARPRH